MADEAPQPLNYIPEIVLKKRRNNEEWAIRRKTQLEERIKKIKGRGFAFKQPEQFIKEYRDRELDLVQMKNRVKRKRQEVAPASKMLFVVRIRGKSDMHPKSRKILYSLRLRKIFNGVFVKANERTMEMLQKVQPFVTYGCPNFASVKDLIYKKALVKIDKERVPLTDNNIIEQELGKYGIICIEDIVNEIANVGPHFKEVISALRPFTLTKPEKLQGKKKQYKDGGDTGNREDDINELISKMLH